MVLHQKYMVLQIAKKQKEIEEPWTCWWIGWFRYFKDVCDVIILSIPVDAIISMFPKHWYKKRYNNYWYGFNKEYIIKIYHHK